MKQKTYLSGESSTLSVSKRAEETFLASTEASNDNHLQLRYNPMVADITITNSLLLFSKFTNNTIFQLSTFLLIPQEHK